VIELPPSLVRQLAQLPAVVRGRLALGPVGPCESETACRVCDVLNGNPSLIFAPGALGHRCCNLFDFHNDCMRERYGPGAYERCLAIYRAAGWPTERLATYDGTPYP
jgi:hypothetical protein